MKGSITIGLFCLCLLACHRDDTHIRFWLPAKTSIGANTFGFLLNDKVWVPFGETCTWAGCRKNLSARFFKSDASVSLYADRKLYVDDNPQYESVYLELKTRSMGPGTYFAVGDSVQLSYYPHNEDVPYVSSGPDGEFVLTLTRLDTLAGIVSGEFRGTLYRYGFMGPVSRTDTLVVADGRFDVRLEEP